VHDKIGQRMVNNSELILTDCRIPLENRLGEEGYFWKAIGTDTVGRSNTEAAACMLGVARAAYEDALHWSAIRVQGGKPIIRHQIIGSMLADMAMQLEAARSLIWRAAWAVGNTDPIDIRLPKMAKIFTSEAAFRICRMAMEIHGGYGIMTELPLEKYLRDASTFLHSDGTNQIMRLQILRVLQEKAFRSAGA
jgi:alkylation response protein AidB-like acyl-CoA dehydrogenase